MAILTGFPPSNTISPGSGGYGPKSTTKTLRNVEDVGVYDNFEYKNCEFYKIESQHNPYKFFGKIPHGMCTCGGPDYEEGVEYAFSYGTQVIHVEHHY